MRGVQTHAFATDANMMEETHMSTILAQAMLCVGPLLALPARTRRINIECTGEEMFAACQDKLKLRVSRVHSLHNDGGEDHRGSDSLAVEPWS